MLDITHQGNANQSYKQTCLHTHQDGYKDRETSAGEDTRNLEPSPNAGGNVRW